MNREKKRRQEQIGFSVLEAIAAIALIAIAFLPMMVLQSQLTRTAAAIERAERNTRNMSSALARLRVTNPMFEPDGVENLGEAVFSWRSHPITEVRPVLDAGGGAGRFDMQLFDITATLDYGNGVKTEFTVRQVGWRANRSFTEGLE